jgi:cation diffusion facilitator family transporter
MAQGDHGSHHQRVHANAAAASVLSNARGVRATWISLGGLAATALVQLGIFVASGSVALLADTIHNATDALTAIPLLVAFRLARKAPTRRYTYGYSRAEDVAGVTIVAMIAASAVVAAIEAIRHLVRPETPSHLVLVLAAGVVGFAGNEAVSIYRIRVGRSIGSAALIADGLHARVDGLTSLGVIAGAVGSLAGVPRADAAAGLAITVVIAVTLLEAARTVLHRILDGTDETTIALIEEVASSVPGVEHVTEARARWAGHRLRTELSVDVDAAITVEAGHLIAERVREALLDQVPRLADAMIHVDPHEHDPHG